MKIKSLIKKLQDLEKDKGNVEVFLADGFVSCNHMYGQIKDFSFYKQWYETGRTEKEGIMLGAEDPQDSMPPSTDECDE